MNLFAGQQNRGANSLSKFLKQHKIPNTIMFNVSMGEPRNEKITPLTIKVAIEKREFLYKEHLRISIVDYHMNHVHLRLTKEQALELVDKINKEIKIE